MSFGLFQEIMKLNEDTYQLNVHSENPWCRINLYGLLTVDDENCAFKFTQTNSEDEYLEGSYDQKSGNIVSHKSMLNDGVFSPTTKISIQIIKDTIKSRILKHKRSEK